MEHGIYYAYWEHEWNGDYKHYIDKAARLGFDILEIAAGPLPYYSKTDLIELGKYAEDKGIRLTVGYGPSPEHNIGSDDSAVRREAFQFYKELFESMQLLHVTLIGGALYSCWPIDYTVEHDKPKDLDNSIRGMAQLGKMARQYGIETLGMECLNRFENHLLNTAKEGVEFVKAVYQLEPEASNVKVMLDTFHMNIEEENIGNAIRTAGNLLGHFHTGECNRMAPGQGHMPWREIRDALRDVHYNGTVVMEPFVMPGGQVGRDIKVWRKLRDDTSEEALDRDAKVALAFQKYMFECIDMENESLNEQDK